MIVVLIEILLSCAALAILVPVSVLFVQVLAALPAHREREMPRGRRPSTAIVVPAHNEALMIAGTLCSIAPQLVEGDRLLVVADNCTDATAAIAAASGAEVVERNDAERRGKNYALDFGVRHLEHNPPEVLIVIDADCQLGAGMIDRLSRLCGETARPVQALYLMHSPEGADLKMRIAEFAWLTKNKVRPFGFFRLGLPCQLTGTGMAFPWHCISNTALASGRIGEDLALGLNLARCGAAPLFCPEALVTSVFPGSAEGVQGQRIRWEHGHLEVIFSDAPRLFLDAVARGNVKLVVLLLDLCVPPLALLSLLVLLVFMGASALFLAVPGAALAFSLSAASVAMLGASVLLAWIRYGRHIISLARLACAPVYALWKIPLYVRFLIDKQVEWVRTKRDEGR